MIWYKKCPLVIQKKDICIPDKMVILKIDDKPKEELSIVSQFFMTPCSLHHSDMFISIPVNSEKTYYDISENIGTHFEKILGIFHEGNLKAVSMQYLKERSKNILMELHSGGHLHPIIRDLYGSKDAQPDPIVLTETFTLRLKNDCFEHHDDDQFDIVWQFISDTYLHTDGYFSISPVGWVFDEHLLTSPTLTYLSKYDHQIHL